MKIFVQMRNGKRYKWNYKKCFTNIAISLMTIFDIAFIVGFEMYVIMKLFY